MWPTEDSHTWQLSNDEQPTSSNKSGSNIPESDTSN